MDGAKIMKYYKDNKGNVYAYELDGSQDYLIGDKIAMTAKEIESHINPPKTPEQLEAEVKHIKQMALDSIIVTTTSGKQFDGREKDQIRMLSALQASAVLNTTSTLWKIADNTVAEITVDELKEALALSIQKVGDIILGGTQ